MHELNKGLDKYLAHIYGAIGSPKKFNEWKRTHQPFHWFSEFYNIVENGGFDVVIGNPPYVKAKNIEYQVLGFPNYPDIYAHITERSIDLLADHGAIGLVIMSSISYNKKFNALLNKFEKECVESWFSFYAPIPSGLFPNVRVQNCILLAEKKITQKWRLHTTCMRRWNAAARNDLFATLLYIPCRFDEGIPRMNSNVLSNFWQNNALKRTLGFYTIKNAQETQLLHFREVGYNFISISPKAPPSYDARQQLVAGSTFLMLTEQSRDVAMLFLAGRVYFSHWLTYGDNYHLTKGNMNNVMFPDLSAIHPDDFAALRDIFARWCQKIEGTLQFKLNRGVKAGTYNTSKLWHITDESDLIFLKYMTDQPEQVMDEILTHVVQTIKTRDTSVNK